MGTKRDRLVGELVRRLAASFRFADDDCHRASSSYTTQTDTTTGARPSWYRPGLPLDRLREFGLGRLLDASAATAPPG